MARNTTAPKDAVSDGVELEEVIGSLEDAQFYIQEAIAFLAKAKDGADAYGGEIARVVGGQLELYTIASLRAMLRSEHQPGSIDGLIEAVNEEIESGERTVS